MNLNDSQVACSTIPLPFHTIYDFSGNMTRGTAPDATIQRFEFDEAGRIVKIKTDAGADIETNTYATSRERIIKENAGTRTYYAWGGSSVLARIERV